VTALDIELDEIQVESAPKTRRQLAFLAPTSSVPTIVGVIVAAIGFTMIGISWSEVAAQTNVALQLPYLVSAGITGLALVMVGLLLINVSVKRQDAAQRREQMGELIDLLKGRG
jgi:hypothetical protein